MSNHTQSRFDLSEFVLGYLEEQGSIITPPEFGIYEALLPEALAHRLELDDYQRFAFGEAAPGQAADDVFRLNVNHPVVERIVQATLSQPANALAYVNSVRLYKRGLAELARKVHGFANARLDAIPQTQEEATLHHYLRCNFKVTLIAEEKQEELSCVVLDVQAGHAVQDADLLRRLEMIDSEPAFAQLPVAPPRWQGAGEELSAKAWQTLLSRAEVAVRQELADQIAALVARMERHLALDVARIEDYYDHLAADMQRRRGRIDNADAARRETIDDKLASLEAERAAKLQDVHTRYPVRVELELVNVLLVIQPKVTLPVTISNRTVSITRTVVWDPLVHRLEPLTCDVCSQPGDGLHLCTGGHLAHADCLTSQCVDCKRAFCQLCAQQLSSCVVCHRPVCLPSLIACPTCGRGTCKEHQNLCHAADGEPAVLPDREALSTAESSDVSDGPAIQVETKSTAAVPAARGAPKSRATKGRSARKPANKPSQEPAVATTKAVRLKVQVFETEPTIVVLAMRSTSRVWATRTISLTPQGILVQCKCEKPSCAADGYYHRPQIFATEKHIGRLVRAVRKEYLVPAKKVSYLYIRGEQVVEDKRFSLPAMWLDSDLLAEAVDGFDKMAQ